MGITTPKQLKGISSEETVEKYIDKLVLVWKYQQNPVLKGSQVYTKDEDVWRRQGRLNQLAL